MIPNKLRTYLELSDELMALAQRLAERAEVLVRTPLSMRNRVLIALGRKQHHSFVCLVEDAKNVRPEAFHHLKTMLETFFYINWVASEDGDARARLLLAKTYDDRLKLFNNSPRNAAMGDSALLRGALETIIKGVEAEWQKFRKKNLKGLITADMGEPLTGWYDDIYKIACEPAHIGDLVEYMPEPNSRILATPSMSFLRTHIALDFGLQVYCELLKSASEGYDLGFDTEISSLKKKVDSARMLSAE